MDKYPFKNLVFRGGGILGIAYLGALKVMDENKILPQIKRVSGASAGAITALATSMCTNADEIRDLANSLNFSKVPDKKDDEVDSKTIKILEKALGGIITDVECLLRLWKRYGWYSSSYFYQWLCKVVNGQFQKLENIDQKIKDKKGLQTFQDFETVGFRSLYISVTNISRHQNEIFSYETQPNMPVANAVRMSMSIPLYFESIELNGEHYADGGTVNNYPMEIFDNIKYADDPLNFHDGINWETLGCHLFTPPKTPKKHKSDNLIHYIENLFLTLLQVQVIEFEKTENLKLRSANISDLGISAVDFDIKADSGDPFRKPLPQTPYDQLYRSGFDGMTKYLKNYTSHKKKNI